MLFIVLYSALYIALYSLAKLRGAGGGDPRSPGGRFELGYWKIRGLGAVSRMLLEYKQCKYKAYEDNHGGFLSTAHLSFLLAFRTLFALFEHYLHYLITIFTICNI